MDFETKKPAKTEPKIELPEDKDIYIDDLKNYEKFKENEGFFNINYIVLQFTNHRNRYRFLQFPQNGVVGRSCEYGCVDR